ncbi:GNAT family N-acetyltransferase [Planomonospora sp. ID91781]|nr:GNAT family N-acetyltransferase [Planomonospora sp. ID91781]
MIQTQLVRPRRDPVPAVRPAVQAAAQPGVQRVAQPVAQREGAGSGGPGSGVSGAAAGIRWPGVGVEVRWPGTEAEVRAPGAEAGIRPARVDDEERIRRFLSGLSLHTQTLRFFTGLGRPAASLVRALLAVDERRDVLLAVHRDDVVGHAMSFGDGAAAVEIAVVVADDWQGLGLGSRLVRGLLHRAEAKGARTVGMDVMGENRRVLAMIGREWPDAVMRASSGTVEVTVALRREADRSPSVLEPVS